MSSKKQGYMVGSPTQVHATMQLMSTVLASMRAVSWLHWTAHWQVRGDYGDHLMFGKFYDGLIEEIDTLAEKCVGYFGATATDPFKQMAKAQECMERFKKFDCLHERGLAAEEDLQVTLRSAHKVLTDINAMTLGLDDYIQSLANTHETNIYLLQQRIGKDDGRPGIEKPPFDFSLVGEISAVQKTASAPKGFAEEIDKAIKTNEQILNSGQLDAKWEKALKSLIDSQKKMRRKLSSEKEAWVGPLRRVTNPGEYVEVIRKSDGKKVKIKKTTLHGHDGGNYKMVDKADHEKHEKERHKNLPKLIDHHKAQAKKHLETGQAQAQSMRWDDADKSAQKMNWHEQTVRKLKNEHAELSKKHGEKTDKKAFNKYNAPELLSQLFAVLGKFELDDVVDELKKKRVPQLVNDAWRKRDKRGSSEDMETTWFSAAYLYSADEENEDG